MNTVLLRSLLIAGVGVVACGFAGGSDAAESAAGAAAVARGEALAEQACSSCHGMGLTGESHWAKAPAFRDMRIDYNAISYERRMAQMHVGRVRMPPAEISLDDVRDIGAYVRSLNRARKR